MYQQPTHLVIICFLDATIIVYTICACKHLNARLRVYKQLKIERTMDRCEGINKPLIKSLWADVWLSLEVHQRGREI